MLLMLALCLTAACSDKNEDEPAGPDNPSGSTTPTGDEFTVKATGGTVEKGDIAITFPSGTFTGETKVYVKEVTKGSVLGEDEASTFYQLTMPVTTKKPLKVSIKSSATDDDICIVAHAPVVDLHSFSETYSYVPLETTVTNGTYMAEIPAFDNGDETDNSSFSIGLARIVRGSSDNARTRASNKVGNVAWHINKTHSFNIANATGDLEEALNKYIREAISIIHGLGMKVEGDRDIPFNFGVLDPGEYGRFRQSAMGNKWSTITLSGKLVAELSSDHTELRKTIIHELMHYYQADYDKRWAYTKFRNVKGDELMMYESGGVWAEKLMNNGEYSADFVRANLRYMLLSLDNPQKGWEGQAENSGEGKRHQAHGYALSLFLEFVTLKNGDNHITKLYEGWKDKGGKTFENLKRWAPSVFDSSSSLDDFFEDAGTASVSKEISFNDLYNLTTLTFNTTESKTLSLKVFTYGAIYQLAKIHGSYKDAKGNQSLNGKQIVINQTKGAVYTRVFINSETTGWKYMGSAYAEHPLELSGDEVEKLRKYVPSGGSYTNLNIYLLTTNSVVSIESDSEIQITIKEPDKLELKPEELTFEASAGTQNVTADTNMDNISLEPSDKSWLSATYDKTGKTIIVSATENKGESKRDGTITVTGKNGDNTIVKTIKVTQAAGVLKDFFNISRIEFMCSTKESHGRDIGWTTYDYGGINYDSRYEEYSASGFTSTREGDYQVITINYQASNYASGGKDENLSLVIRLDKDFNAEGSFSVTRKTHAGAGAGSGFVASTCNMTMSGTFGPEAVNKTYSFLWYPAFKPKSFSYSVGGFKAYFWETNSIEDFGTFSTSSTDNAEINIVIR